jgi:hypothetical protein
MIKARRERDKTWNETLKEEAMLGESDSEGKGHCYSLQHIPRSARLKGNRSNKKIKVYFGHCNLGRTVYLKQTLNDTI